MNESLEERVTRLEAVYNSITRIDGKLASLDVKLDAIIRIEQKQSEHSTSLERAFLQIDRITQKAYDTDDAFKARANVDDGRRQTWNLVYGALQIIVLAAVGWQFNATETLKEQVRTIQAQLEYRLQSDREK